MLTRQPEISLKWARRFFDLAEHVSTWSKDRSTKVGAVIFNPETNAILSIGYNGFPRGVHDCGDDVHYPRDTSVIRDGQRVNLDVDEYRIRVEARHARPAKYSWSVHSELNALLNCSRHGIATDGMAIALQWYPCMQRCAPAIVQAGLRTVICTKPDFNDPRYGDEFKMTKELFDEVGMQVITFPAIDPKLPK